MKMPYPKYLRYQTTHVHPSVLDQEFPVIDGSANERLFYPDDHGLAHFFSTDEQVRRFAAARFCGFLSDTIAVEQDLVIPSIASVNKLPELQVPLEALEDLYNLVADEGHHAEQSLRLLNSIENAFNLDRFEERGTPLFMRRLSDALHCAATEDERHLIRIVNGVVTETRISIELGKFASNEDLSDVVRDVCRSHQTDEAIHASQFKALGVYIWQTSDTEKQDCMARYYAQSAVARSMPDIDRLSFYLEQVTDIAPRESVDAVTSVYTAD